jgi:hypothetical protein
MVQILAYKWVLCNKEYMRCKYWHISWFHVIESIKGAYTGIEGLGLWCLTQSVDHIYGTT